MAFIIYHDHTLVTSPVCDNIAACGHSPLRLAGTKTAAVTSGLLAATESYSRALKTQKTQESKQQKTG